MARVLLGGNGWIDPSARLAQLSQQFQQSPGRAPGGSGATGLMSGDARGYDTMLADQREYGALRRLSPLQLQGNGTYQMSDLQLPVVGSRRGDLPSTRTLDSATGEDNRDAFSIGPSGQQLPASVSGAAIAGLKKVTRKPTTRRG